MGAERGIGGSEMALVGVLITLLGWVIAVMSVSLTSSVGGRMVVVLIGIALCLIGIIGVINRAFLKNAIWRR
jgi:MFS-type transporter involved in bile tolerance (Atg22 family)